MQKRREQLLEELHKAEQARDLLREVEHNLSEEKGPELPRPPAPEVRRIPTLRSSVNRAL
jgi:hypothetical protein